MYTTNAIESLNSVLRKVTKKRQLFSSDDSVKKVIYLVIPACSRQARGTKKVDHADLELESGIESFYD